jgi:hypothetical protein
LMIHPAALITDLFEYLHIDPHYVEPAIQKIIRPDSFKWKTYANNQWFENIESHCESVLQQFFSGKP